MLKELLEYDHLANKRLYVQLFSQNVTRLSPEAIDIFGHMLSVQKLWCDRIDGIEKEVDLWPNKPLAFLEPLWLANRERLQTFIKETDRIIEYTNDHGEPITARLTHVLYEVVLNGEHCRGQIAALMRQEGLTAPTASFTKHLIQE